MKLDFEHELWANGISYIAGVDEVGRGCLFGDVVAAAVILPKNVRIDGLDDSKKLSEKKRDLLFDEINQKALAIAVGIVHADVIDEINIKQASRLAMKHAIEQLQIQPQHLLIDAETVALDCPQTAIVKGDARSASIAAASVIAKVTRDRMCETWEIEYPGYGILVHKGYATKQHREAIKLLGPTLLHRKSFLKNIMAEQQLLF